MWKKLAALPAPALALLFLLALLRSPAAALEGGRRGLAVCAGSIVPALLPFLVLSGLVGALGLADRLAGVLARPLARLFAAPGCVAAPFLLGLCGGYPVGAASLAGLVRDGALTPEEAGRALPFCNNTGPAFLLGAVGLGVFGSGAAGGLLWGSHALAAVLLGLLGSVGHSRNTSVRPSASPAPRPLSAALPESVRGAVTAALNISGFVVFFSVLTALAEDAGLLLKAAGVLSVGLGLELHAARALLIGLLELGGAVAAMQGLAPTPGNLALAAFLLGFGSLSVHGQTLAALEGTDIKASRHFAGRLVHGLLSAGAVYCAAGWMGFG
jgi:sporulation integral membrane protein YlbJ